MKKVKTFVIGFLVFFLALVMMKATAWAGEEYKFSLQDLEKNKKFFDDPRPFLKELHPKKILPADLYTKLTYDVEAMKNQWAKVVGFRAPEVVGKVAPEIKPGSYTYKDKEKYPGFKELMIPEYYKRFNPGAPPFAGNFSEIRIVPTRQYYYALPVAEATQKNEGLSKLDDNGILRNETYVAGYPFPKPSGKFMANQLIYNWQKRYSNYENNSYMVSRSEGFSKSLRRDRTTAGDMYSIRLHGRVITEPYGWYDERAKRQGEDKAVLTSYLNPRDYAGNVVSFSFTLDPDQFQRLLMYVSVLRRVRIMTATDLQQPGGTGDIIFADPDIYGQNLSTKIYPYKCEVISEREYLVPTITDGSGYFSSEGGEMRNFEFERRPIYVVKMTQLDKNFVYSYRILYIDKETFLIHAIENYDQKGRLYRSGYVMYSFVNEMGMPVSSLLHFRDHLDLHSTMTMNIYTPAPWVGRQHTDLQGLVAKGK